MKKRKYSLGSLRKFTDIINSEDHYLKREGFIRNIYIYMYLSNSTDKILELNFKV